MPPSAQVITKQIESTNEQRKTFHLDANAHFLFYPLLSGSSQFWTEQAGAAAGGVKRRTDEFRQAVSRLELRVG